MIRLWCRAALFGVLLALTAANRVSAGECPPDQHEPTGEEIDMNGAVSPAGAQHPGVIAYEDEVEGRQWSRPAADVPQSVAWVEVDGVWQPVVRIVSTGTADQREIAKFGVDGGLLEITVQSPPARSRAAPEPTPQPMPEPLPRSD